MNPHSNKEFNKNIKSIFENWSKKKIASFESTVIKALISWNGHTKELLCHCGAERNNDGHQTTRVPSVCRDFFFFD